MSSFPYIHISCPCHEDRPQTLTIDSARPITPSKSPSKRDFNFSPIAPHTPTKGRSLLAGFTPSVSFDAGNLNLDSDEEEELTDEDDDNNFDPRDPRSAFSLFPIENLLYCEDCHQIRCPRCVQDEIVLCTALLAVVPVHHSSGHSSSDHPTGPFNLFCSHCHWTTSDLTPPIQLEKPTSISAQLSKLTHSPQDTEFIRLKQHYAQQLGNAQEDFTNSPAALTRLMGLYTGLGSGSGGHGGSRKGRGVKKLEMKEVDRPREVSEEQELDIIERMAVEGLEATTTAKQRLAQPHDPRFLSDLTPTAVLLRTKRSKRCRACRHILVKPEAKVQTTRFRIRLVALNYIPSLTIKRLDSSITWDNLTPHKTHRFLLTVTNPLFDPISVSLLTPRRTPGTAFASRVTILCPEFDVGANTDVWDDALMSTKPASAVPSGVKTPPAAGSFTSFSKDPKMSTVYEQKRNYTSVVIEVVPPEIPDTRDTRIRDERLLEIPIYDASGNARKGTEDAGGDENAVEAG
ncbi:hypothetical protein TWF192_002538 [Orbilia oligospora]|nr:hypothetical protein TWF192_002538 [Orbilia oligospora]